MPGWRGRPAWPACRRRRGTRSRPSCSPRSAHPVRKMPGDVLLHDALAGDAVWIAAHDQRPVPQIRDDRGSHLPVVLDEISLADPVVREERLVGACHLDADVIRAVTALAR